MQIYYNTLIGLVGFNNVSDKFWKSVTICDLKLPNDNNSSI